MRRGTTPTHTFGWNEPISVSDIKIVKVTYAQGGKVILEKRTKDCTLTEGKISVRLTQEETMLFKDNEKVKIQGRIVTNDKSSYVSDVLVCYAKELLDDEVLM